MNHTHPQCRFVMLPVTSVAEEATLLLPVVAARAGASPSRQGHRGPDIGRIFTEDPDIDECNDEHSE